ncbi:MAG: NAD-dependent epimerase/dehydratase family protein [Polyangiaceae bacterium]|jgi:nucleoside-diphosphate-sugar epimerase|nr:NAD-dependent epimerase/dehydratase family protein [Polyangiaceae bacterium]
MEQQRVAITGVGGFIGRRLAERLQQRGARVIGLELSKTAALEAERCCERVLVGEINDQEALRALCEGATAVIHTAAIVAEQGDRALFQRVNVEGTRQVAEVARASGVRRMLHVSSVMVYGFSFPDQVGEDGPLRGEGNPYSETKIESERVAWSAGRAGQFEVVVARPGDVYGPRSIPWVVRPLTLMKQGLFVIPSGGQGRINHVHIDNLVDGMLLCLERGRAGHAYNLSDGVSASVEDYFLRLARLLGQRRIRSLPAPLLKRSFALLARGARWLGKTPPAYPEAVDYLLRPGTYSIEAARALGYRPRLLLDEGMAEVERWLAQEGLPGIRPGPPGSRGPA